MLLHLTPAFLTSEKSGWNVNLVDFSIKELGLKLRAGEDLVAGRPYPNKHYLLASPKASRKALTGVLIEAPEQLSSFTAVTRWAVGAEFIHEHVVEYVIPDAEYDAATDQPMLWDGERMHRHHKGSPLTIKPLAGLEFSFTRERETTDVVNERGQLVRMVDRFVMPTIARCAIDPTSLIEDRRPPSRVMWDRHPPISTVFRA